MVESGTTRHEYLVKAEKQCTDGTDFTKPKEKLAQKNLKLAMMPMKRDLSVRTEYRGIPASTVQCKTV